MMQNLYEIVKGSLFFNKFILNDLVCVEYTCPIEDEYLELYSHYDYIVHVLSGKKTWKTMYGEWTVEAGQSMYVKKGASVIYQYFDDDFCMLAFFLPDDLIRECLNETFKIMEIIPDQTTIFTAEELENNKYLEGFFQSMLVYFKDKKQPPESLLKYKFKELLFNIVSDRKNEALISYLLTNTQNNKPSLTQTMESNFCYNLSLEEYAKLSHRSLSKFKRDFYTIYKTTPGKWLRNKRLEYSASLLKKDHSNITQIAFESGFEDVSHFSRAFKEKFNVSPRDFRNTSPVIA